MLAAGGATLASAMLPRNSQAAGKPMPEFRFRLADGTERTLADYAGRPVVLNFWATWCAPCVAEMASLDALAAAMPGAAVLPLSSDRGGAAAVQQFYASHGLKHLGVLLDPMGAAARAIGARGIPTTLLVDPRGQERGRFEGAADWGSDASQRMVRALEA